eukprot:3784272-Pleurochrysis_carterae.AAC.1
MAALSPDASYAVAACAPTPRKRSQMSPQNATAARAASCPGGQMFYGFRSTDRSDKWYDACW